MTTKLFKLTAAADIRVSQGKYDLDTVYTLISKTDDLETPEDKVIYLVSLLNKYYDTGSSPIANYQTNPHIDHINHPGQKLKNQKINCSLSQGKYASELALELMLNVRSNYDPMTSGDIVLMQTAQYASELADLCQDKVNIKFMNKMEYLDHMSQMQLVSFMKKMDLKKLMLQISY